LRSENLIDSLLKLYLENWCFSRKNHVEMAHFSMAI
jgi:hypothetical protein